MSLRKLLGLENTEISDTEIMKKIREAMAKNSDSVTFATKIGEKIVVKLPRGNFSKHIDPWDGQQGRANYPKI